ncbi:MAG: hypothetical protein V4487_01250 [Chlamydiota bacterium]
MRNWLLVLFIPFVLGAQNLDLPDVADESPQQIEQELADAEAQFAKAKKMFNPWYTGPLVTPSASMMPPGYGNIQPYLYFIDNYAQFNEDRESISLPSNLLTLKGLCVFQFGVTNTMDILVVPSGVVNWQSHKHGGGFNDLGITIGFPIYLQTLYIPQIKFTVQELFPTGKYQHLSTNGLGLNATGGGAYQTTLGLTFGKILFWSYKHPMNTRLFLGYTIPTSIEVRDFNTYGGGFGTKGTVRPGNSFSADFGIEFSVTQRWVLALDIVYSATEATTFCGDPGVSADGTPASVGGGYNDNLSLAPAIEYNWNENFGVLGGAWFSVYGRNSLNFASGIISLVYTFGI